MDPGLELVLRKVGEEVRKLKASHEMQEKRIKDLAERNTIFEKKTVEIQSTLSKQAAQSGALRGQLQHRENGLTSAQLELSSQRALASYYKAELEKERASGGCCSYCVVKLVRFLRRCCCSGNRAVVNVNYTDSNYGDCQGHDLA